jgi:hypothetical protein
VPLYQFRVTEDLPDLGWRKGDLICYAPGDPDLPYSLHRTLAIDPGAILNQLVQGVIEPVDIIPPSFREQIRAAQPSAPRVLRLPSAG